MLAAGCTAMLIHFTGFSLLLKTSHTQEEKFQLPPRVSLVSAKLFIDLGVDPLRLLGLLTQAAGHHRLQRHRRSGSEKDPTDFSPLKQARKLLQQVVPFFFSVSMQQQTRREIMLAAENDAHRVGLSIYKYI